MFIEVTSFTFDSSILITYSVCAVYAHSWYVNLTLALLEKFISIGNVSCASLGSLESKRSWSY